MLSAAVVLAASCEHSNDVTGGSSPTINIAGAWSGSFAEAASPSIYGESFPALASLQQTGASVDGTIHDHGLADPSGTANGTVTDVQLTITLAPQDLSRAGRVVLRR